MTEAEEEALLREFRTTSCSAFPTGGQQASPRDTALWGAIEEAARRDDARAAVIPIVLAGFTDSHFFREQGIVAYGWSPILLRPGDGQGHAVDERLPVDSVRRAPRMLFDVLTLLASLPGG